MNPPAIQTVYLLVARAMEGMGFMAPDIVGVFDTLEAAKDAAVGVKHWYFFPTNDQFVWISGIRPVPGIAIDFFIKKYDVRSKPE